MLLLIIPVTHSIGVILWAIFHAWYMAFQYLDYPADNHSVPLPLLRREMQQNRGEMLGFGFAALLLSMVPVINFIAMPASVAGATRLWIKILESQSN